MLIIRYAFAFAFVLREQLDRSKIDNLTIFGQGALSAVVLVAQGLIILSLEACVTIHDENCTTRIC